MHEPAVDASGPADNDFDDIEWELSCSTREAGVGYVQFADSDQTGLLGLSDFNRSKRPWAAK